MKLDSVYKVKKYLEWVAKIDRNNAIQDYFEKVEGRRAKSLYEVLNTKTFIDSLVIYGELEDDCFTKKQIKDTLKNLKKTNYYL